MGNKDSTLAGEGEDAASGVSGRKGGISKQAFPVNVTLEDETFEITVPHNYATNGWLLREALSKYKAIHHQARAVALKKSDGDFLDLSTPVSDSLESGAEVTAVTELEDGKWDAASQSISRNDYDDPDSGFDRYDMTTYEVLVQVGGDQEFALKLPNLQVTVAWVLSESIRRYMAENDDQDPGILGLQTSDGRDLDLGEDVVEVLASGDIVHAVSYTVKSTASDFSDGPKTKSEGKKKEEADAKKAEKAENSPTKKMMKLFSLGSGSDDSFGGIAEGDQFRPIGQSAPVNESQERKASNTKKDGQQKFKPLRDLVSEIQSAETRERTRIDDGRHGDKHRPTAVVTFDVETSKDPTGELPRYVTLSIDTVRLGVLDKQSKKILINWRYEEIHGWIIGTKTFSVKLVKPWGMQIFDFTAGSPSEISKALLARVNSLITGRKHQKQQALLQKQKLAAKAHTDDLGTTGDVEKDQKPLDEFEVERQIDPSGTLPRHLILEFTTFQIRVLDLTTRDVLFEWPYVMIYAWGLSKDLFVAAVSVAPPNVRRASFNKHIKKDKNELHYLTYAFKTDEAVKMQQMMRTAMEQVEDSKANTEVFIPQKMEEDRMKETLQEEWDRSKSMGGSCYTSKRGDEQMFTFEDANYDVKEADDDGSKQKDSDVHSILEDTDNHDSIAKLPSNDKNSAKTASASSALQPAKTTDNTAAEPAKDSDAIGEANLLDMDFPQSQDTPAPAPSPAPIPAAVPLQAARPPPPSPSSAAVLNGGSGSGASGASPIRLSPPRAPSSPLPTLAPPRSPVSPQGKEVTGETEAGLSLADLQRQKGGMGDNDGDEDGAHRRGSATGLLG